MKISFWPQDTIAYRLGMMLFLSMAISGILMWLFFSFGGVWAQPPMNAAAWLKVTASLVRLFEAAPQDSRDNITAGLKTQTTSVIWIRAESPLSLSISNERQRQQQEPVSSDKHHTQEVEQFIQEMQRVAFYLTPNDVAALDRDSLLHSILARSGYNFFVKLKDDSWLVMNNATRTWGLSYFHRFCIWIFFSVCSFLTVSAIVARKCARPFEGLAQAIRHSGLNPLSPPIPPEGPRELKVITAAFNDMQKQIQELIDTRTFMLAAISHDLRTPLTRIRLRIDYIVDRIQRAKLRDDVDEMQTMIDSALSFFGGDTEGEPTRPFDLAGILQSIVDDYEDRSIKVVYAGPGDMTYVGRPLALKRAFTNLIENAAKYASPPTVALVSQAEGLAVTIRDHGPGIPDEEMDRVFKPYFRLDKSRNLATGGIGLGLTIAQTIVRRHGGDITLRNHPSGGLEATVRLPWPPGVDGS